MQTLISLKNLIGVTSLIILLSLSACVPQTKPDPLVKADGPNTMAASYNVQLGMGYLKQGKMARSKTKLLMALKQAPNWAPALDAMAYFFEATGDLENAKEYYLKSISVNPNLGSAQNNYGTFLCRRGEYKQAIQRFVKAASMISYTNTAEAYENAGLCATLIPDNKLAKRYFERALKQNPSRPNSLLGLSQLFYKSHQYKQSYVYLQRYKMFAKPTAQSLWLGIRLGRLLDKQNLVASNALLLKHRFSNTKEYREYLES